MSALKKQLRSVLLRCLMMAVGACLAGWSLNHAPARNAAGGISLERITEAIALFVGLGLAIFCLLLAALLN